jgi:uncharacterized membrane protein YkoI
MRLVVFLILALALTLVPLEARSQGSHGKPKITKNEAEHIALSHHHGARVTAAKLEEMDGKMVWLIEVSNTKSERISEVTVDARSGRVLSDKK